jgi:hypothetical protein
MTVAYYTGWRVANELCTRRRSDVIDGWLTIAAEDTKDEESRRFPLDVIPELSDIIEQQLEATRRLEVESKQVIPWLFHHDGGKRIIDYLGPWHKACAAAGLVGRIRLPEDGGEELHQRWRRPAHGDAARRLENHRDAEAI